MNKPSGYEGHHVIPLSLGGLNVKQNLTNLLKSQHDIIHDILNLEHKKIRSLRCQEAQYILAGDIEGYLKAQHLAQQKYFANLDMLPENLIKKHCDSIIEQIKFIDEVILSTKASILRNLGDVGADEMSKISFRDKDVSSFKLYHDRMLGLRIKHLILLKKLKEIENYRLVGMQKPNFLTAGD